MYNIQKTLIILIFMLAFLTACTSQDKPAKAAPLDDKTALEKLARSYKSLSESLPTSPVSLNPGVRKKFVVKVFEDAGYNYSQTLFELAEIPAKDVTQYHRDMRDLLFLPHHGSRLEDVAEIYSETELEAVKIIKQKMN